MPPTATALQGDRSVPLPGWAQSGPGALQPAPHLFSINAQMRGSPGWEEEGMATHSSVFA